MPNDRQQIDVVIGGRSFKLAASENTEYIEKVAAYIDNKLKELNVASSSDIMQNEYFSIILALNIADDLFKERENNNKPDPEIEPPTPEQVKQIAELKAQLSAKINDYNILLDQFKAKSDEVDSLKDAIYSSEDNISKLNIKTENLITEAETSKKTIENKSQYIIDLTKKISDKNQELNALSKKLAEKNTALNELNKKSAERNIKLNNVNKERDELAIKLKSANNNIRNLEKEIADIKKAHENEIKALNASHTKDIDQLNENHQKELKNIKSTHEDELFTAETAHKAELDSINAANRDRVDELSTQLLNTEIDLRDIEYRYNALKEDSDKLKDEYEKFQARLLSATDGQFKAAFAKTKSENIELRRTIENMKRSSQKE